MNRRIVFSVSVFALALCLAIIALPVTPVGATNPMQGTAAPENPCVPKPKIPGTIVATEGHVIFSQASESSKQLLIAKAGDIVEVLGRNQSAVWIEVVSNSGLVGWVPSAYILIDKKQLAKLDVIDGTVDAVAPVSTMAATMSGTAAPAATMAATALINPACPGITGTITGDAVSLKALPRTQSADEGTILKAGNQVQVVELNSSGSWFRIVYKGHTGWVGNAFVFIKAGASVQVPHNYTDVEITMTPVGQ